MDNTVESLPTVLLANRYRMRRLIGKGGMGAVYEAFDENLDKEVAVKLLLTRKKADEGLREEATRLRDEARAIAKVRSPFLVTVIDAGDEEDLGPFIVYELLKSASLRDFLSKNELTENEVIERVARPLLLGLAELHNHGIVHRDVKPDNVMQSDDGSFKVGDLGLAHFEGREAKTKTGVIVGTPGYLAPEAFLTDYQSASNEADIYSATVVIVESIARRLPYSGDNPTELVKDQLSRRLTAGDLIQMGVSHNLAPLLASGLSPRRDDRPKDACLYYEELREALSKTEAPPIKDEKTKLPQRGPWLGFLLLCLFCSVLFLAVRPYLYPKKATIPKERPIDGAKELVKLLAHLRGSSLPSPILFAKVYVDGSRFHERLKEKGSKGQKVWMDIVQSLPPKDPARLLLQSIAAKKGRGDNILASTQAREASLQMRSLLKREKSPKARDIALETILFHHRFNCLASAGSDAQTTIIEPSRRFMTGLRNRIGDNDYFEGHRIVLLLCWALAYANGHHLSCLQDMAPALSVIGHRERYPEPTEGIISSLSNDLCERLYELNKEEFTRIAHSIIKPSTPKDFSTVCREMADMGFRFATAASMSKRFLPRLAKATTSRRMIEIAKTRTDQKYMNESVSLLRQAAWALAGSTIIQNVDPRIREEYSDLLLDIAETRVDGEILYVRKEDWGLGFTIDETIERALLEVDALISQVLETKDPSKRLIYETYVLNAVEEWLEETVDISRQKAQQIAPVLARLKRENSPLSNLLLAWHAYFVLQDERACLLKSKNAFDRAKEILVAVKDPSEKTINSNFVRLFDELCKFRWRLLHKYLNNEESRLGETDWALQFFEHMAREWEDPAGHYRAIWSLAVVHNTEAARRAGQGDYLDRNKAKLQTISRKSRYGKISILATNLLAGKAAGIGSP